MKLSRNVKIADFLKKMFEDIKIAIIKPGFGTIQECLKRGIAINDICKNITRNF